MDIVKKAKLYIKNMKATDSTSEHHKLIVGLLLEVKCLKVQVQDRGNSYQRLTSLCDGYREALAPFAAAADVATCPGTLPADKVVLWCQQSSSEGTVGAITVADCRRAKAALQAEKEGK